MSSPISEVAARPRHRHKVNVDTREKFMLAFYRTLTEAQRVRIDQAMGRLTMTLPPTELAALSRQIDLLRLNKNTSVWFVYFLNAGDGRHVAPVGIR